MEIKFEFDKVGDEHPEWFPEGDLPILAQHVIQRLMAGVWELTKEERVYVEENKIDIGLTDHQSFLLAWEMCRVARKFKWLGVLCRHPEVDFLNI